jgi:hypothetical protein
VQIAGDPFQLVRRLLRWVRKYVAFLGSQPFGSRMKCLSIFSYLLGKILL